jgi:hypothetical protein
MGGVVDITAGTLLTFSPLVKAFSQNDLTAVHEILVKRGYKDDEVL